MSGVRFEPNDEPEETAVPANSTPREPWPVVGLYLNGQVSGEVD